jgi:hypothetical protein
MRTRALSWFYRPERSSVRLAWCLLPAPHPLVAAPITFCRGSASFSLGLFARAMGRWDDALRHLDNALAAHRRIVSPPWVANAQCAMADVLLARDQPGDREHASALLAEVLETTKRLGMQRLQRKALALEGQTSPGVEARSDDTGPRPVLPEPPAATLLKEGEYWVIAHDARTFRLKDRLGLRYLAELLCNPGKEYLAIDLAAGVHGRRRRTRSQEGTGRTLVGGPEPYLDATARCAYVQRVRDLGVALDEARIRNDSQLASRTQAEIDFVTEELQRGIGLGGRTRPTGSPVERARVSVTRAIKGALHAIAENDPALGHYLAAAVKTGTFCSYSPNPRVALRWDL